MSKTDDLFKMIQNNKTKELIDARTDEVNVSSQTLGFKNYQSMVNILKALNIEACVDVYNTDEGDESQEALTLTLQGKSPKLKKLVKNLGYNSITDLIDTFNILFTEYYVSSNEIQIPLKTKV